jgi:hypothetical protein
MNWLWMLIMRATTASKVSRYQAKLGLITPRGLASSARRDDAMSAPW